MSDDSSADFLNTSRSFNMKMQVMGLMMKGAGYAALLFLGVLAFVYVFYLIGLLLPEDSKTAPDPTPVSFEITLPETPAFYDI